MNHSMNVPRAFPLLAAAASFTLLVLVTAAPAAACTCVESPPPAEALEQADLVFTGTVTKVETIDTGRGGRTFPQVAVRFDVDDVYKGRSGAKTVIETAESSAACGYTFEEGVTYLVYAFDPSEASGAPTTSLCTRTAPIDQAGEDLDAFGEPIKTYD